MSTVTPTTIRLSEDYRQMLDEIAEHLGRLHGEVGPKSQSGTVRWLIKDGWDRIKREGLAATDD